MEGTPSGAGRSSFSGLRYFSDSTGRILSEEERAKENVYIQLVKKMERERLEKLKKKAEKEKAEREKSGKVRIHCCCLRNKN
nr:putative uncharacterized transmembrane protein DDB_G0293028 isoform X1 [Ipomoea batatas]